MPLLHPPAFILPDIATQVNTCSTAFDPIMDEFKYFQKSITLGTASDNYRYGTPFYNLLKIWA